MKLWAIFNIDNKELMWVEIRKSEELSPGIRGIDVDKLEGAEGKIVGFAWQENKEAKDSERDADQ